MSYDLNGSIDELLDSKVDFIEECKIRGLIK